MPETRYRTEYTYSEDLSPEEMTPVNATVEEIPYEVSDKQLAEEAERKAMEKAKEMIDSISNLADAKVFLKKLCLRLFKNGALP